MHFSTQVPFFSVEIYSVFTRVFVLIFIFFFMILFTGYVRQSEMAGFLVIVNFSACKPILVLLMSVFLSVFYFFLL